MTTGSMFTAQDVMQLRTKTGAGVMDCKKALQETNGDIVEALTRLREIWINEPDREETGGSAIGILVSYVHPGDKIAVVVGVSCKTDFVARTEELRHFANEVAMHVAFANPTYLRAEEIPAEVIAEQSRLFEAAARREGKSEALIPQIVEGKLRKFTAESVLLEQSYVRDPSKTIGELLQEIRMRLGENIRIARFVRATIE